MKKKGLVNDESWSLMNRVWPLAALGIGAFVVFALVTLPARVVLSRFNSPAVKFAGVSGTVWSGQAQALRVSDTHLGSIEWTVAVLPLFMARLDADVKVTRVDGFVQGAISVTPTGRLTLQDLTASLPIGTLPPNVAPGGWTGTLNLKFERLVLGQGWPVAAEGALEAVELAGPARKPVEIGSYKITFPAPDSSAADALVGALVDAGGPLQVTGTVQLKTDRSYVVEGLIATRPGAPVEVADTLQYLGAPDAQGRRPFSLAGTL